VSSCKAGDSQAACSSVSCGHQAPQFDALPRIAHSIILDLVLQGIACTD
jgi:hypothetical protein